MATICACRGASRGRPRVLLGPVRCSPCFRSRRTVHRLAPAPACAVLQLPPREAFIKSKRSARRETDIPAQQLVERMSLCVQLVSSLPARSPRLAAVLHLRRYLMLLPDPAPRIAFASALFFFLFLLSSILPPGGVHRFIHSPNRFLSFAVRSADPASSSRESACRRTPRRRRRTSPWTRRHPTRRSPGRGGSTPICRSSFPSHVHTSISLSFLYFSVACV